MTRIEERKALIIEDDLAWQGILGEILTEMGFKVQTADNLQAATAIMRQETHRLAVIDISLGGPDHRNQDGITALGSLKRYDPGCVALVLTGFATVELAVEVMQAHGALACIRKDNFRRTSFRDWVEKALLSPPGAGQTNTDLTGTKRELWVEKDRGEEDPAGISGTALIVEDDAGWRSLLSELVADAGYQCQVSSSYVEALGLLTRQSFQLAVVDISLASSILPEPNRDGYLLLAKTRAALIPTIIVSGFADPARIEKAYQEFGILACIEKQAFDRTSFLQTVQRARKTAQVDPAIERLTEREREILILLSRGYTNKEIAAAANVSTNTIKRHLKSIFSKLEVNSRAAASARAVRARLVLE